MSRSDSHYVKNADFYAALITYRQECEAAAKMGIDRPPVPDYLGECFLRIATHLSYKPNFASYSFREDMISDGVENSLQYMLNFDPAKSDKPFSYFTQIIYFAFLRRIEREKKQMYIRCKVAERANITREDYVSHAAATKTTQIDQPLLDYENMHEFINAFENRQNKKKHQRKESRRAKFDGDVDLPEPEEIFEPVVRKRRGRKKKEPEVELDHISIFEDEDLGD